MQRPARNKVTLTEARGRIGMSLLSVDGCSGPLIVNEIKEGAVRLWNEQHPDEVVALGDNIIEINGTSAPKEHMLERLHQDDRIEMTVLHYVK
eukprot:NODE_4924_length_628_cov_375.787086.p3 GENE.NODE_4924_length_628_cov_375.787086~~NODE_4924_length_628_cov_375.787086.p3  ORF type:complete len:93 (-),score=23.37 NODE_4924_length_628_cov_375.787086:112-390(-)